MERSFEKTDVNVELDLSTNGQFGPQRNLKPRSTPITPKAEPEAERAPPTTQVEGGASSAEREPPISHPPPQVEGVVGFVNSAPPQISHASEEARTTTARIARREAALRVALKQMKSQRPPRGNNNNDVNAASQAPVLRQQTAAAVDAMNGRRISAGAANVEAGPGRTKVPRVYTRGAAGGNGEAMIVRGFLHRFDTVESISILCVCHGLCHTPAQFVEHAGGGAAERERPLRHIVVVDAADYFAHQTPSSSHRRPF